MIDEFNARVQLLQQAEKANKSLRDQFYDEVIHKEYFDLPKEERNREARSYLHNCGAKAYVYADGVTIYGAYNKYYFRRHRVSEKQLKIDTKPEDMHINISRSEKIEYYQDLAKKIQEEIDEINRITPEVLEWMEKVGY